MYKLFLSSILISLLFACTKSDIDGFSGEAGIIFDGTTVSYTFLGNPSNEYIQEVPVRITGDSVSHDRSFTATVVKDTFTTAPDNQYEILGGVVEAGKFTGTLKVKLRNSPALATSEIKVKLKLVDGPDFKASNGDLIHYTVIWSNKIVIPSWTYYRLFFCSASSSKVYRLIVETSGLTTFTAAQYRVLQTPGAQALGTQFGDYIKQWNLDHPNDHLKHDDGAQAGNDIVPVYYSRSKFD